MFSRAFCSWMTWKICFHSHEYFPGLETCISTTVRYIYLRRPLSKPNSACPRRKRWQNRRGCFQTLHLHLPLLQFLLWPPHLWPVPPSVILPPMFSNWILSSIQPHFAQWQSHDLESNGQWKSYLTISGTTPFSQLTILWVHLLFSNFSLLLTISISSALSNLPPLTGILPLQGDTWFLCQLVFLGTLTESPLVCINQPVFTDPQCILHMTVGHVHSIKSEPFQSGAGLSTPHPSYETMTNDLISVSLALNMGLKNTTTPKERGWKLLAGYWRE